MPRVPASTLAGLFVVAAGGLALRLWVLGASQGAVSADEAYTGLQAFRILDGDLPLVIEGQAYTAVFDSYLLAPILGVVGASVWVLKALPIVWWALASILIFRVASRVCDRPTAMVVGSLFWLAPGALMILSTRSYEGYGAGLVFVLVSVLAAQTLLASKSPEVRTSLVLGAASGLAFYAHPMYLAVIAPILVMPSIVHRRCVRRFWLPLIASVMTANAPLIVWNIRNDWSTLDQPSTTPSSYFGRLGSLLTEVVPRVFGLRDFDGGWTLGRPLAVLILVVVTTLAAVGVVAVARTNPAGRVIALVVVTCLPVLAIFRNTSFVDDARYGIVFFPFLVLVVVAGASSLLIDFAKTFVVGVVLVGWCGSLVVPWLLDNQGPRRGDPNTDARAIVEVLQSRGFDSVAGSFWWVLPIEYLSDRDIRGAVVGEPFTVRVIDSQRRVEAEPGTEVPYVFAVGDEQIGVLPLPGDAYERQKIGDAVVYLPRAALSE